MSTASSTDLVPDRLAYRPREVAQQLGLSRARVYELMASGDLPYRQVGSVRLVSRATIDAFLAGAPDEAA